MESGLIFNQLICEFESRHPCQVIIDCRMSIADDVSTQITIGNWQSKIDDVHVGRSSIGRASHCDCDR